MADSEKTDEQRVKAAYPDAVLVNRMDGARAIWSQSELEYLGWGQITYRINSEEANRQAWSDAARRLDSKGEANG